MIKELSRLAINTGMSTLSNVNSREGGLNPFGDGLESSVISEVRRLSCREVVEDGVSSDYVQKADCQWFVLRATYNRVEQDFDTLKASVIYAYLPKRIALKQIGGKKKRVWEPLLPNLVFVYSTKERIEQIFRENRKLGHYRFYRDRTQEMNSFDKKHPPVVVPYHEMMNFIRLTSVENEHIKLVTQQQCHYRSGDRVRVVDGDFVNVEGRVARIAGQQRVVVEMQGVCLVATAYIPSAFLYKIT